jgi:2-polyprenyl-6-methoxyphenol hydroxylase-like FAD-dependent oxidoreductase
MAAVAMSLVPTRSRYGWITDGGGLCWGRSCTAGKEMEAEMSVDDFEQGHTVRTGEPGIRVSGPRVLVAGASIAGPALAHWLRRRGAEVTVVERAPQLRPGGQAVDARGVAKEVIGRMGLNAAIRAACTDTAGAHTVDAHGQVLETFRADDDDGDGFIADIEILRGDLSQVLYDDTRDGVEYLFGDRIAELTQDTDGVDVVFAGGRRRRFDLVVGADGLHSELRAMVFGPHEHFLHHLGHVLAFYSVPNEFGLDRWLLEYQDQESGRSALLRPIQDATRAMAMFYLPSADFDVDHRDVTAQKRLLRERMAGLGWLAPDILAHLDDTPDFYLDQVAQVVMDRWSSGRVGLLGDAAFSSSPMSGQGTGLALVGAYLLAGELAAADWDPGTGFTRYETRMRPFVEANQEIGRLNARSHDIPQPDAEPHPDFASQWFTELVERAINGIELPHYPGTPDSQAPARSPITTPAKP